MAVATRGKEKRVNLVTFDTLKYLYSGIATAQHVHLSLHTLNTLMHIYIYIYIYTHRYCYCTAGGKEAEGV